MTTIYPPDGHTVRNITVRPYQAAGMGHGQTWWMIEADINSGTTPGMKDAQRAADRLSDALDGTALTVQVDGEYFQARIVGLTDFLSAWKMSARILDCYILD